MSSLENPRQPPEEPQATPDGKQAQEALRVMRSGAPSRSDAPNRSGAPSRPAAPSAEERLSMTLHHAPLGMAIFAPDGRWLNANRALCELVGYTEAELLQRNFWEITHPDDLAADLEYVQRFAAGELDRWVAEKRYIRRDGSTVWVKVWVSVVRDGAGRVDHVVSQILDISAEKAALEALVASERRFQSIAANVPGMVYRFAMSPMGEFSLPFVSEGSQEIFGIAPERLREEPELSLRAAHPDDRSAYLASIRESARTLTRWDWRWRVVLRDGTVKHLHGVSQPWRQADGTTVWDGVLIDVSDVHEAETREAEARRRFEVAFERAPIGMVILSLDGHFVRVNEALYEMLGYDEQSLPDNPFTLFHPDEAAHARADLRQLLRGGEALNTEYRIIAADGDIRWVHTRATLISDADGRAQHVLAQLQDVTERRGHEDKLRHLADHDPLTGLLNRRGFEQVLGAHLAHVRRYGAAGALLVLDLDGFKFINDTLGHAAGDELIVVCSRSLRQRLRESDVVARLGGDEFALLLPEATREEAAKVAEAVVEQISSCSREVAGGHPWTVTASVGVAPCEQGELTPEQMLVNADLAMYDAKAAGKDCYAFYAPDSDLAPRIQTEMLWLERIRHALDEGRFALYAQPVIELSSGRTRQHEVLLRMLDERGNVIAPREFLHLAERFGVIRELDRWVVAHAIQAMARPDRTSRPVSLAVNISGLSTGDPELLETIVEGLRATGVDPSDLTIEITETAAIADMGRARIFADALAEIGCRVALDDFGAGFGSFYYLKHLPFDVLKIDGEFVRHAIHNPADCLLIKAVTGIARGLGKETVAEAVPDDATADLLRREGVDHAQGYHLGRPVPLEQALGAPHH